MNRVCFALILVAAISLGTLCSGCHVLAYLGYLIAPEGPEKTVEPEYAGLDGKSIAVVINADQNTLAEYPTCRLEIAGVISGDLDKNLKNANVLDPRRVVKYQDNTIDWDAKDRTKLGEALGVQYVLYISLGKFTTRESGSEYLFRGEIIADAYLYQTNLPETKAKVWSSTDLRESFPKDAVPASNDAVVRAGLVNMFSDKLAKKFYKYKAPKSPTEY